MDLARTDTYINVYLPRVDCTDPRRYTQPSSPVFNGAGIYKFSDQIVKDRKLFIDKKHTSLYDIYYKDSKENGRQIQRQDYFQTEETDNDTECDQDGNIPRRQESHANDVVLPRVNNVRLSLDRQLRRAKRTSKTRFNESVATQGSNRYVHTSHNADADTTSFEINTRRSGRLVTKGAARTRAISKLFKKAQSAPTSDLRQVRILGLPPVSRSNTSVHMSSENSAESKTQTPLGRSLPLRPSSKPNKIWRQSTNVFMSGFSAISDLTPSVKKLHTGSVGLNIATIGDNNWA